MLLFWIFQKDTVQKTNNINQLSNCILTTSSGIMSKASPPELKKFMDKKLGVQINSGRYLAGVLRGYDPFMNVVIDDCVEKLKNGKTREVSRWVSS